MGKAEHLWGSGGALMVQALSKPAWQYILGHTMSRSTTNRNVHIALSKAMYQMILVTLHQSETWTHKWLPRAHWINKLWCHPGMERWIAPYHWQVFTLGLYTEMCSCFYSVSNNVPERNKRPCNFREGIVCLFGEGFGLWKAILLSFANSVLIVSEFGLVSPGTWVVCSFKHRVATNNQSLHVL